MKAIVKFFLSLKTTFGLFSAFVVLAFIGSISLPGNLAFFSGIDDTPLFGWLSISGNFRIAWWIYGLILMLALTAVSTILCTADVLLKKLNTKNIILKLSPQIMHIGVLLIMLGHLLTASIGFKIDLPLKKGEEATFEKMSLYLEDVNIMKDKNGYDADLEAKLLWLENGRKQERILRPVHPLYSGGIGLYFKSAGMEPEPSVLIRVCRDPGALWALIGGILLSIGGIGFVYGRFVIKRQG